MKSKDGYYLCKDSSQVPDPHDIGGTNVARKNGICRGYDASVCDRIYWRNCDPADDDRKGCTDSQGNEIAYPCTWNPAKDGKGGYCDVDPRINPKTKKSLLVKDMSIGKDNKAIDFLDKSCFERVGDPDCLYGGHACVTQITKKDKTVVRDENAYDAYTALRCWVGANGVPYSANADSRYIKDRSKRTYPPAYSECTIEGSNCIPKGCGCDKFLNNDRWLEDMGDHCADNTECEGDWCS
jgi:hypothetical protein